MLALIAHFGDTEDSGTRCGTCDRCRPEHALFSSSPTRDQSSLARPRSRFDARVDSASASGQAARQPTKIGAAKLRPAAKPGKPRARPTRTAAPTGQAEVPQKLLAALHDFRRAEAKARGIPAFRVLTDRALYSVAHERPRSTTELLAVHGVGPSVAKKYGERLLAIVRDVQ